jgi:hypothetical protein
VRYPVVLDVLFILDDAPHNVFHAKVRSLGYSHVFSTFIFRENKATGARLKEVNCICLITLKKDELIFHNENLLEQWTDPSNERH